MSTQTTNLGLVKPSDGEYIDNRAINGNMDKLDAAVGAVDAQTDGSLQAQVDELRESVSQLITVSTAEGAVPAANAGDVNGTALTFSVPSGYRAVGVIGWSLTTSAIIPRAVYLSDASSVYLFWYARTNAMASRATAFVLCVREI